MNVSVFMYFKTFLWINNFYNFDIFGFNILRNKFNFDFSRSNWLFTKVIENQLCFVKIDIKSNTRHWNIESANFHIAFPCARKLGTFQCRKNYNNNTAPRFRVSNLLKYPRRSFVRCFFLFHPFIFRSRCFFTSSIVNTICKGAYFDVESSAAKAFHASNTFAVSS